MTTQTIKHHYSKALHLSHHHYSKASAYYFSHFDQVLLVRHIIQDLYHILDILRIF